VCLSSDYNRDRMIGKSVCEVSADCLDEVSIVPVEVDEVVAWLNLMLFDGN
jgi:hypothetical protein